MKLALLFIAFLGAATIFHIVPSPTKTEIIYIPEWPVAESPKQTASVPTPTPKPKIKKQRVKKAPPKKQECTFIFCQ